MIKPIEHIQFLPIRHEEFGHLTASHVRGINFGNAHRANILSERNASNIGAIGSGTSYNWYDRTIFAQDGKCALCKQPETHPVTKGWQDSQSCLSTTITKPVKFVDFCAFGAILPLDRLEAHGFDLGGTCSTVSEGDMRHGK